MEESYANNSCTNYPKASFFAGRDSIKCLMSTYIFDLQMIRILYCVDHTQHNVSEY